MDVKKLVRFGCPYARLPQSTSPPPPPFLGFSSGPKYHHRIVCKYSPRSVSPSLASNIRMIFSFEFREGDVKQVFPYLTESGLIYSAVRAQVLWLIELLSEEISPEAESLLHSMVNRNTARLIANQLLDAYGNNVYLYYVEAVRSYLKEGMCRCGNVACELVDSSCTKEDIDSLAHGLTLKDAMDKLVLPAMDELIASISAMVDYAACFEPTVLNNIASRLGEQRAEISDCKIGGGNFYGSSKSQLAERFVGSLGLSVEPYCYQTMAPLISGIAIFNTVLIDFDALMSELIKLNPEMKMGADFARSKIFLSAAKSGLLLLDKYYLKEEGALPPLTSSTPTSFFWDLVEVLERSLVGYQIAKKGIRKLELFMLQQPNSQ